MAKKKKTKSDTGRSERASSVRPSLAAKFYARCASFILAQDAENTDELERALVLGWSAILLGERAEGEETWRSLGDTLVAADLSRLTFPADMSAQDWKDDIGTLCATSGAKEQLSNSRIAQHVELLERSARDLVRSQPRRPLKTLLKEPQVLAGLFLLTFLLIGFVRATYTSPRTALLSKTPNPKQPKVEATNGERPLVYLDQLANYTEEGSYWAAAENKAFESDGIDLYFREPVRLERLSLSLDGNDSYIVRFFDRNQLIAGVVVGTGSGVGMRARVLRVPFPDLVSRLDIIPITGDNRYSLGHVELLPPTP